MVPTGKAWRYAALTAVLMGCGSPQGGGGDASSATDVATGSDTVTMDVVNADVVAPRDVPQKRSDVVDAAAPADVPSATDVSAPPDATPKGDGSTGNDATAAPDVMAMTDATAPDDVRRTDDASVGDAVAGDASTFTCPMGIREIVLPGMAASIMGTTSGMGSLASTGCQANASGPEHFYTLRVTERTGVILDTENMATVFDTLLTVRRCDTGSEVACDDDGADNPSLASRIRTTLDPGTYTVIVDGFSGGSGAYVLNARSFAVAPNSACTGALALSPGATLAMQDLALAGMPSAACARTFDSAPLYYSITVPPNSAVTVTATPTMGETWTPSIRALDTCTSTTCAALGTSGSALLSNTTATPRVLQLAVSRANSTGTGTFSLTATAATALAANASCMGATTLALGASLTGQDLGVAAAATAACNRTFDSVALYYNVTVPANSRVSLSVTPTAPMGVTWTPSVRVLDACDAMTCVLSRAATTPTQLVNTGAAPRSYRVIVARASSSSTGAFTIAASMPTTLAPNASCSMASTLPPSGITSQDLARAGSPGTACLPSSTGEQLFYTVSVPPNSAVTVVARPTGAAPIMWTPVIRLLDACDATTCVGSATGTTGNPATLLVVNGGSTERSYKLSVAATTTGAGGTFDLEYSAQPVGPASVCERPIALLPNGMAVSGDTALGIRRAARCNTSDMGNEVFYSLEMPAGSRVALRAAPTGGGTWRPRLRVLSSCDAISCTANATTTTDGGEATLNIDNTALLPQSVLVSVSATTTAVGGTFSLTGTTMPLASPSPYTLATIPAACENVASGSTLAPSGGWADDSASAVTALPFTVRFFGTDATHYSVSSNGFAQLWTSMTGMPSSVFSNVTLPNTAAPNNFVAPYWDDLVPVAMTSLVRTQALGVAPVRRFIIEWRDWRHIEGGDTDRLTFQAKLFEGTGVIEFHYCSMMPVSSTNTGGSTSIGVEDAMGMAAGLVSFSTPNRAVTGTAYRLTPR